MIVLDDLESDPVLGDHRLEVGLNIADLAQNIDELDVVEPVSGEARDLRGVGEPVNELVVEVTAPRHDEALIRGSPLPDDDLGPGLPAGHELREILRRILEVAEEHKGGVPRTVGERREDIPVKTEVTGVEDGLHPLVLARQSADRVAGAVRRVVIDEDDLVVVLGKMRVKYRVQSVIHQPDAFFLIVTGDDDADLLHGQVKGPHVTH